MIERNADDVAMLRRVVVEELSWQASLQLPNGALPMHPQGPPGGAARVCPYFACIAALSLLIRPARYAGHVRRYLIWHFAHLNDAGSDHHGVDGTIYDYWVTQNGRGEITERAVTNLLGRKQYDSTDSYAALLLILSRAYLDATGDGAYLAFRQDALVRAYTAMLATFKDGLSYAKPGFFTRYTMDNCEVWQGLLAAEGLFHALARFAGSGALAALSKESAARRQALAGAIERRLWNARAGHYEVGVNAKGRASLASLDLRRYYPDAMAQLFPILTGVLPPDSARAKILYATFNRHFSAGAVRWERMEGVPGRAVEYGLAARVAVRMGDAGRALSFLRAYEQNVLRKTPSSGVNAERAHAALAARALLSLP